MCLEGRISILLGRDWATRICVPPTMALGGTDPTALGRVTWLVQSEEILSSSETAEATLMISESLFVKFFSCFEKQNLASVEMLIRPMVHTLISLSPGCLDTPSIFSSEHAFSLFAIWIS